MNVHPSDPCVPMTTPTWYVDYLASPHWTVVRAIALYWAERRCQVCNDSRDIEVHHRTYERLGCERPADITVLCTTCHGLFHGRLPAVPATDPRDEEAKDVVLRRPQRTADYEDE